MMRRSAHLFGKGTLLIAYGSQTGTAEMYARMLGPLAVKHNFDPVVCSLDEAVSRLSANSNTEPPKAFLTVCSTYGTGEFPSNAHRFAQAIESKQLPKLEGVDYSILGLGNSHNDAFNAAAKSLDKMLKKQGARSVVRMQLSCESTTGHDVNYRTWKRSVWNALSDKDHLANPNEAVPLTYSCPLVLDATVSEERILPHGYARAHVNMNRIITPEGYEPHVAHLTFTVPVLDQIRRFGNHTVDMTDNVMIMPKNPDDLVERAIKRLGVKNPNAVIDVMPLAGAAPSYIDYRKMRIRQCLRDVTDLSSIPSRSFLESLGTVCTDAKEATHMDDLANDLGANSEYDHRAKGVFTIMDALEMCPSAKISLEFLLSHAPHLQARAYSLARDNVATGNHHFELVYTVPKRHDKETGKAHIGVCTGMMERLATDDDVYVKFVPSPTRKLPANTNPLCIVALGSGIGAARAVLERRRLSKLAGNPVAPAVLFYGFRHAGKDELFTDVLNQYEQEGIVEVRRVASHDGPKFTTPLDIMDASLGDFLLNQGELLYCGMGGSVPSLVEGALRKCGVDVSGMRATGRYHEEYFTSDPDTENLLRVHSNNEAKTLAARMGDCSMFCMQCEQTFRGKGCHTVGVCGKTPRVASLQDLAVHQSKILGFYAAALRAGGAPEDDGANRLTLAAMFATLTNVNFDESRFVKIIQDLQTTTARLVASFQKNGIKKPELPKGTPGILLDGNLPDADGLVALGRTVGVLTRFTEEGTQSASCIAEMLTYGLKGVAAYTDHSLMNGKENKDIYEFLHRALAFLVDPSRWSNLGEGLGLCLECGKVNVLSTGMLYDSNATLGVPSPHSVPVKPKPGKAILVSGHDLIMTEALLKACKPHGINVYTHGELLPAHSYPKLREHANLAGHFGGAWMRQSIEFPHFPGPVLMTTNCLTEPHESYRDTIFTAGAVGWEGVTHLGDDMASLNLEPIINAALQSKGFTAEEKAFTYPDPVGQKRPEAYTVGFGHETILGAAPTIIEQIKKGNITRFYLVGGCDGFEGQRSYYTDLVKNMEKTGVVLTLGCGKFRVNHLEKELGTIGDTGIPRILDMGQCNDSYSAVQVALALAKVLDCKVSDLPLTIVLSWFEQKAVAVLLSCLHLGLKPIHIGPTLPAFVTPEILDVLVNQYGVTPIGNAAEDVKKMAAAKGAS